MTQLAIDFDAPAQRHSQTSLAADGAIASAAASLRGKVLAYLRASGGATDEQGIEATGIGGSTWRPRRRELVKKGLVKDSGTSRHVRSGLLAVVWIATDLRTSDVAEQKSIG